MSTKFEISEPRESELNAYAEFTVTDGEHVMPGRISRRAMQILADGSRGSFIETFNANLAKIRRAAFLIRAAHPRLPIVYVNSDDIS
jgi:hypothetical protein